MADITFRPLTMEDLPTPIETNVHALRVYEKAGFRHLKTVEMADEPGSVYLMRAGRPVA